MQASTIRAAQRGDREYLAQPFYVAEPFTARRGETVDPETLRAEVAALLVE